MDGVLVVDKPRSLTSHDVVTRVRRQLGTRRVGHIGTLDPMATGVLPLVVGRATRLASLLSEGIKVYDAVIHLGLVTDTYDATGAVVSSAPGVEQTPIVVDRAAVQRASLAFTGTFRQRPPPYSAKKVGGVRAYRLARRQVPVKMKPATVTVYDFEICDLEDERLYCRVRCAPGFYMRSLAHDLGESLGCGGCLETLRRERSGVFRLDAAVSLDTVEHEGQTTAERLIPLAQLLPELPGVVVTDRGARLAAHGNALSLAEIETGATGIRAGASGSGAVSTSDPTRARRIKIYDREGALLAIAESDAANVLHPRIVLV